MLKSILALCLVFLTGCATTNKYERKADQFENFVQTSNANIQSKIGVMTYDEAISGFGPPTASFSGDAIETLEYSGGGEKLLLSFDKQTRLLTNGIYTSSTPKKLRRAGQRQRAATNNARWRFLGALAAPTQSSTPVYVGPQGATSESHHVNLHTDQWGHTSGTISS